MRPRLPMPDFSKRAWRRALVIWIAGLNILFYLSFAKSTSRFWGRLLAYISGG